MYRKFILFPAILFSICLVDGVSQDEKLIRKILTSKKYKKEKRQVESPYHFKADSPIYKVDLDGDEKTEYLQYRKRDHENILYLYNKKKVLIKTVQMELTGAHSTLYKILLKKVSEKDSVLILFFYEGMSEYTELYSSARVYILSFDKSLKKLSSSKGFPIWEEHRNRRKHYHRRKYDLVFKDLDQNGILEIMFKYENISRVIKRDDLGIWKML